MPKTTPTVTAALVGDTFREAFARLIFWGFYGLSTAMIAFFLFLLKIDVVAGAKAMISVLGDRAPEAVDVTGMVTRFQAMVAVFLYTWGMALAVFASGGLIPTVLEPGRIELLISKPVRRYHLLLGRFLGNVLVVALNITYLVVGVWLILGWKTGVWNRGFLWAIPLAVFMFTVLLTVVLLVSVMFESAALAVMVTFGLMMLSPLLAQTELMERLFSAQWTRNLWKAIYYVIPKVYDVGRMTLNLVRGTPTGGWMPVWTSVAFATVALGGALYLFSRRDY